MKNKRYLIGIYTSIAKSYCDEQFFEAINKLPEDQCDIAIVDNSKDMSYHKRLFSLCNRAEIIHIKIDTEPQETLFLRKVARSANLIRSYFLHNEYKHLLIIESDVIVPENLLQLLNEAKARLEHKYESANENVIQKKWGIIGGLYYKGIHKHLETDNVSLEEIIGDNRVFSGCTLYNRSLIENTKFRFTSDLRVFPDSHMSHDAVNKGYSVYHYNKIKCDHIEKDNSGLRGRDCLND